MEREPRSRPLPPGVPEVEELRAKLAATFDEELRWRLRAMADELERLRIGTSERTAGASLESLARQAHSIKGGAMVVGQVEMTRLAASLEERFDWEARNADGRLVIGLDAAAEALAAIGQIRAGTPLRGGHVESLVKALRPTPRAP